MGDVEGRLKLTKETAVAFTQEGILTGLAEIISEVTGTPVEDVRLDKSLTDDLDVDAVAMADLVAAVEGRFDVKIPDEDVSRLRTVGDMADYILGHQG
jgi:acyl carrier protein